MFQDTRRCLYIQLYNYTILTRNKVSLTCLGVLVQDRWRSILFRRLCFGRWKQTGFTSLVPGLRLRNKQKNKQFLHLWSRWNPPRRAEKKKKEKKKSIRDHHKVWLHQLGPARNSTGDTLNHGKREGKKKEAERAYLVNELASLLTLLFK